MSAAQPDGSVLGRINLLVEEEERLYGTSQLSGKKNLLLVVLDYVDRARLRCVRILSDLPQCSSLAQQVPALIWRATRGIEG
jgi:hypothetical protein